MRLTDPAVTALAAAACGAGTDLYLRGATDCGAQTLLRFLQGAGGKWAILLPGEVPVPVPPPFLLLNRTDPLPPETGEGIPVCDVRLLNREDFFPWLAAKGVRGLLLPFSECAFVAEHGYRASYRQLGERRAEGFVFSVTALLTDRSENDPRLREILLSPEAALLDGGERKEICAARFTDGRERDRYLLSACVRSAIGRTVVLFPSRDRAESFRSMALRRDIPCGIVHGGRTEAENRAQAEAFLRGEIQVLSATKYLLPSAPFFRADAAYYAGLPFSVSHALRVASLAPDGNHLICTTEEDQRTCETLSRGFAAEFGADAEQFLALRRQRQRDLLAVMTF